MCMDKDIKMPNIGEEEFEVIEIMVKIGDNIKIEQPILLVEGNKTSIEIPSSINGIVKKININIGDKVTTGMNIMVFDILKTENIQKTENTIDKKILDHNDRKKIHASPLIRRLAKKFNINLININGSGKNNRILKDDIYNYIRNHVQNKKTINSIQYDTSNKLQKINFSKFGTIDIVELNNIQKITNVKLTNNWISIPHVTYNEEIDITEMENFRKKQNIEIKKNFSNIKITPLIFLIKSVSHALKKFPKFNSSLLIEKNQLVLKKYINIGIAVDTDKGLLVPVLHTVNKKNIMQLTTELYYKVQKAKKNKLKIDDIEGGCFTISNLGGIGGKNFTPIINFPEVAILGISQSIIKPIWNGKEFLPKLMLPVSLSFDHRVINGADAARFIAYIKKITEDIRYLLI